MGLLNTLQDIVRDVYESTGDLPVFRGLVLQSLEAMSNTDEKTCRFAIDDFLDDFSDNKEIGQMAKRKLVQRYARVFSRLQNVRSTKRFPELHASMASAALATTPCGAGAVNRVPSLAHLCWPSHEGNGRQPPVYLVWSHSAGGARSLYSAHGCAPMALAGTQRRNNSPRTELLACAA